MTTQVKMESSYIPELDLTSGQSPLTDDAILNSGRQHPARGRVPLGHLLARIPATMNWCPPDSRNAARSPCHAPLPDPL